MHIIRVPPPDGAVVHHAETDAGRRELWNELRFLRELASTPFVPEVLGTYVAPNDCMVDRLTVEDVGESLDIMDEYKFRTHFLRFLWELKQRQIEHGDLTSANIRVVDDIPKVLDWKESRFALEDRPTKRPEGDVFHAFQFLKSLPDGSRHGRRFAAMLKAVVSQRLGDAPWHNFGSGGSGGRWIDVGCYHGDIPACAAVAGFENVMGIDSDLGSIAVASERFGGFGIEWRVMNAIGLQDITPVNVLSCLSTYPYILNRHGDIESNRLIEKWIDKSDMMFFECQLSGDGPGPVEFETTRHIEEWLYERGADSVEAIVEIEITDRHTTRTTFQVS